MPGWWQESPNPTEQDNSAKGISFGFGTVCTSQEDANHSLGSFLNGRSSRCTIGPGYGSMVSKAPKRSQVIGANLFPQGMVPGLAAPLTLSHRDPV